MKSRINFYNLFDHNRKMLYIILSIVMIAVLTLTIVYAALSTTLNINGQAEVIAANWNIHFDNIQVNSASVTATTPPTISNGKTVNFGVTLSKPGDFYKFSVDIVNDGDIDAMIDSVVKSPELTSEQAKYIKYEIEYSDGISINSKQLLPKDERKTISVLVSYRYDIVASDLPSSVTTLNLSFMMIYTQADITGTTVSEGSSVKVVSGDLNTVGSEICIGAECFYLMENNGRSVTMFAKYNLYVGNECTVSPSLSCRAYGEEATGLQNSMMQGSLSELNIRKGTLSYSTVNYWIDMTDSYPFYVYNSNSNLYKYVESYKTYLLELGIEVENARLITLEELIKLGCKISNNSCTSSLYTWIYSTSYWIGTAGGDERMWRVLNGYFGHGVYGNVDSIGTRPVVEIPLAEF